jgi:TonB family protein
MSAIRLTALAAALCALLGAPSSALAQTQQPAPSSGNTQGNSQESVSDRTRRLADNPLKWIMMQDDRPRRGNAPASANAQRPATPAAAAATAPAQAAAAGTGAARPAAAAATPAATSAATPAAATAAAPAAAARTAAAPTTPGPAAATPAVAPAATGPATTAAASSAGVAAAPAAATQQSAPVLPAAAVAAPTAAAAPVVEEDQPLKLVKQVAPEIGRSILQRGIRKGDVRVSFTVMPDGTVTDAAIVSTTNSVLNAPILAAVRQWRYEPIRRQQQHGAQIAFDLDQ